jgi:hypothetical protein
MFFFLQKVQLILQGHLKPMADQIVVTGKSRQAKGAARLV